MSRAVAVPAVVGHGLACHGVSVELDGTRVVDNVALDVAPGEWLTIVGPNGAGKTTLLRAIAGLCETTTGTIEIDGASLPSMTPRARARMVAFVPQTPILPPGIAVLDYVLLGRTPHIPYLASESAADLDAAREALELLDLVRFASRALESLSGGELQRVLLGRALAQQAPLVLLDEPTTALDIGHQQEVLEIIDRLRVERRWTVISTMHDLTLAGLYADRLVLIDAGQVVADGPADAVLTEEILQRHYGANVRLIRDGDAIIVVPHRDHPLRPSAEDER
jgi:iron complex transport system ATP-binding protein